MNWQEGMEYLREINIASISLRIILAMVMGGILGSERGRKNSPAGFRTYMLVSVASAIVMMTNQYVFTYFSTSDPVRMGAQVVSGVGFLGAGAIITTGNKRIKGMNTAASLWAAACSGLAIGIGFYEGAVIGGAAILLIMTFMQQLDNFLHGKSKFTEIYIEFESAYPFSGFMKYATANNLIVTEVELIKNKKEKMWFGAVVMVKSMTGLPHMEVIELLEQAPGAQYVEEL